jgi:hypothetical protein
MGASKKYNLDQKLILSSWKYVGSNLVDILAGTVGHVSVSESNYIVKLAYMFNAIAGLKVQDKSFDQDESKLKKYFSLNTLYIGQSATEVMNQLPLMLGFMRSYELTPGYTMFDAIRINGEKIQKNSDLKGDLTLVYETQDTNGNDIELEALDVSLFSNKLNDMLSLAQGDYGVHQKVQFRQEYLGSLALTFAGWLYPNLRNRFSRGKTFDKKTQKQDFGGYQRTFLANMFGSQQEWATLLTFGEGEGFTDFVKRQGKDIGIQSGKVIANYLYQTPLHILAVVPGLKNNKKFNDLRGIKSIKKNDEYNQDFLDLMKIQRMPNESEVSYNKRVEEAYEEYLNMMQNAAQEYTFIVALILIGLMASTFNDDDMDDDEKNKLAKFIEIQSRALISDMSLGAPLLNPLKGYDFFNQRAKDPFVLLRTITNNSNLISNLIGFQINLNQGIVNFKFNDVYERSGIGYDKGDSKLFNSARKTIFAPYYKTIKFFNPEIQDQTLKMLNKNEIFTDKDLSENNDSN